MHLRMTGALLFDAELEPVHTRVRLELDGGHRLIYVDPRRFGTRHLVLSAGERDAYLAERLRVEPFSPQVTPPHPRRPARGPVPPGQGVPPHPPAHPRGRKHYPR